MKVSNHSGVEFKNLRSKPGAVYEDGVLDRCLFDGGVLSPASETEDFDPASRCTVRRVTLTRCKVRYPLVGPAIFEDVTIDRLDIEREALFVRGAAFKHVTLKGNTGSILLHPSPNQLPVERIDRACVEANREYYRDVDWALDIREVRARELSVRSVPVDLVRYDPEHQAVVRRTMIHRRWQEIRAELAGCVFAYPLGDLYRESFCDGAVLCVPLRAKKDRVAELTAVLKRLRQLDIAEPA
jgi:hypothetical protein